MALNRTYKFDSQHESNGKYEIWCVAMAVRSVKEKGERGERGERDAEETVWSKPCV